MNFSFIKNIPSEFGRGKHASRRDQGWAESSGQAKAISYTPLSGCSSETAQLLLGLDLLAAFYRVATFFFCLSLSLPNYYLCLCLFALLFPLPPPLLSLFSLFFFYTYMWLYIFVFVYFLAASNQINKITLSCFLNLSDIRMSSFQEKDTCHFF